MLGQMHSRQSEKGRNPHSRRHEGVSRNPVRASAKDTDVIYLEEPSESRLVDQCVLHNADATESDPLNLGIKYLTLLKSWTQRTLQHRFLRASGVHHSSP
jgi:hypothetical protein